MRPDEIPSHCEYNRVLKTINFTTFKYTFAVRLHRWCGGVLLYYFLGLYLLLGDDDDGYRDRRRSSTSVETKKRQPSLVDRKRFIFLSDLDELWRIMLSPNDIILYFIIKIVGTCRFVYCQRMRLLWLVPYLLLLDIKRRPWRRRRKKGLQRQCLQCCCSCSLFQARAAFHDPTLRARVLSS